MKRIHYAFFIIMALLLSGCSVTDNDTQKEPSNVIGDSNEKILVAYFSWAKNAVQDNIDAMTSASVRALGNVAQLAAWVAEKTGGELFSIQVPEPYPADLGWLSCPCK